MDAQGSSLSQGTLPKAHPEGLNSPEAQGMPWELLVSSQGRAGPPEPLCFRQREETAAAPPLPFVRGFSVVRALQNLPLCTARDSHAEGFPWQRQKGGDSSPV